jgi:hypothetical protein
MLKIDITGALTISSATYKVLFNKDLSSSYQMLAFILLTICLAYW